MDVFNEESSQLSLVSRKNLKILISVIVLSFSFSAALSLNTLITFNLFRSMFYFEKVIMTHQQDGKAFFPSAYS